MGRFENTDSETLTFHKKPTTMSFRSHIPCCWRSLLLLVLISYYAHGKVTLDHLANEYIPITYDPESYEYCVDAAEQSAYDENGYYIYTAG